MIGCINLLSVIRVTTVSVKVLFVIVSVIRPKPVGVSGNSMPFNNFFSGFLIVSETTLVESLFSLPSDSTPLCRKWGGIIAWKSSLVSGFDTPYMSRGQHYIVSKTVIKRNTHPKLQGAAAVEYATGWWRVGDWVRKTYGRIFVDCQRERH